MTMALTDSEVLDLFDKYYSPHAQILFATLLINENEKKRGTITCTTDEYGCIVAVTRTDDEHRILEVIAEGKSFEGVKNEICG